MLLEVKDLVKKYFCKKSSRPIPVLNNISLKVAAGRSLAITGPSGSGKSTLLYLLGILDRPDSGHYFWEGADLFSLKKEKQADFRRQNIGFVFQNYGLLPNYPVFENVLMALKYSPVSEVRRKSLTLAILEQVGLPDRLNHFPRELSGGECQRLGLARSLIGLPKLLLADEPTGNLDEKNSEHILSLFKKFHQKGGTLIIVTHNPKVAAFCQERLVLENGALSPA